MLEENNKKYIARIYEKGKPIDDMEFSSPELPLKIYFSSDGCLHPDITKIELIKKTNGIEKIIKTRKVAKKCQ